MSRVVVDLSQLTEFLDRLELLQRHLVHAHDYASVRVRELHVSWTGGAALAHAAAHAQWSAAAVEVQDALAVLRSIAATAHRNYAAAALANRRMWAR
jgi:Proteins of 100 residues with WXG.